MTDRDLSLGAALLAVFGAIALVLLVGGCGATGPTNAQRAVTASAVVVAEVDTSLPPHIDRATSAAIESARAVDGFEAALAHYDELMQPWTRATRALEEARSALRAMQAALEIWKASRAGKVGFFNAVACALPIFAELAAVLQRAGVDVPSQLTNALRLLLAFSGGTCPEPEEVVP